MRILTVICSGVGSRDTCVSKKGSNTIVNIGNRDLVFHELWSRLIFRGKVQKIKQDFLRERSLQGTGP